MLAYQGMKAYYGDIHNHCGISYGLGELEDALKNARERLDFCSVTGHAAWPDMPPASDRTRFIADFHHKGFARLKKGWGDVIKTMRAFNHEGRFICFLGFEVHSNTHGDYTILYKDIQGEIIPAPIPELKKKLAEINKAGGGALMFPHHIAYKKGNRGINWDSFEERHSPIVEIVSLHGCSESDSLVRPFLGAMGPSDWQGTMQYGLEKGHVFGVCGNTDHHFAFPGSYGHGMTGLWAQGLDRAAIWQAINDRRTYALTGDRINLAFALNGRPMGSVLEHEPSRCIEACITAGDAIDYIDVVKNSQIIKRFTPLASQPQEHGPIIRTKLYLELGWGFDDSQEPCEVEFGISEGEILSVEPRFRGDLIVSPLEVKNKKVVCHHSRMGQVTPQKVAFSTHLQANANHFSSRTQGVCIEVELPRTARINLRMNGKKENVALMTLLEGSVTGNLKESLDTRCWKLHKAPHVSTYEYSFSFDDAIQHSKQKDNYYLRVKQVNDQWAWSSPVFIGYE